MNKRFYVVPLFAVLALASCGSNEVVVPDYDESKAVDSETGYNVLKTAADKTFEHDVLGLSVQKTFAEVEYHSYTYESDEKVDTCQYAKLSDVSFNMNAVGLQSLTPATDFKASIELKTKAKISLDLGLEKLLTCDEVLNPRAYISEGNLYFNLESQFYSDAASAVVTMISRMFMPTAPESKVEVPQKGYIAGVVEFDEGVKAADGLKDMFLGLFASYSPVGEEEATGALKDNIVVVKKNDKEYSAFVKFEETPEEGEGHKGESVYAAACLDFSVETGFTSLLLRAKANATQTNAEYAEETEGAQFPETQLNELHQSIKADVSLELDFKTKGISVNLPDLSGYEEVVIG